MKRYFTYKEGASDKFWSVEVSQNKMTVIYGRAGTAGIVNEKTFDSDDSAQQEAEKLIREKMKKGYAEQTLEAAKFGEAEFWNIIERAKKESDGDPDEQAARVTELLTARPEEDIFAFQNIFNRLHANSYQSRLWAAAYIISGGCSDDGFDYFRAWLIGQGKAVFENALVDPETLGRLVSIEDGLNGLTENELLMSAALDAFCQKTGKTMDDFYDSKFLENNPFPEIILDWDEENLDKVFPKLAKKFYN